MKRFVLLSTVALPLLLIAGLFAMYRPVAGSDGAPDLPDSATADPFAIEIVRAYYPDESVLAEVRRWTEPWSWDREAGYILLDVTGSERLWLEELGFRLEVDEALTARYSQPNEYLPGQGNGIPGYACYRTVEETFTTIDDIVSNHPQLASLIDIGDSWVKAEGGGPGYDMLVLKLTNSAIAGPKPILFSMSSVHAREYAPAELSTRFAEYLINNYGSDADVTWLLDYHEIHLLLQANPDGRKMAESGILWRKNTNENYCSPTSTNRGADLNRNFPFQWDCCGGSSNSACSLTYHGPTPESEPEVQAITDYVSSIFADVRPDDFVTPAPITTTGVFLDLHSFSQLVIWPWGHQTALPPNSQEITTLGRKMAYFNNYLAAQATVLGITDGTTDDFAYGTLGVAAYTIEMGTEFFQQCSVFENTIVPANMPSLLYAAKSAQAPYMLPAGPEAIDLSHQLLTIPVGTSATITFSATLDDTRYSSGSEPVQNIAAAEFYIDTPPWITATTPLPIAMTPADGNFDSSVEVVNGSLDASGLALGRHSVFIRGQDAAGNWGIVAAFFVDVVETESLYLPLVTHP
ncbi:MAG: hypothetical protein KDE59_11855 [Anaerolineales bacterium]|nr:hypothetical protein [Anaerolineales bacterium]